MKRLLFLAIIVLHFGCSSSSTQQNQNVDDLLNPHDDPTEKAYYSAVHYDNFFSDALDMPKLKKKKRAIQAQKDAFDMINNDYDSLKGMYILYKRADDAKRISEKAKLYQSWENGAKSFIAQNRMEAAFERYDEEFQARLSANSSSRKPSEEQLQIDIRAIMEASGIPCLSVVKAESGCLWVYTTDIGRNRDGLAKTLCYTAGKYSINCVSVFDADQNVLGRSMCR
jgi:hypothetical protein